jgi:hypothetical protein
MDAGGIGELLGVAIVGAGVLVGWRFGPKAERKVVRTALLVAVGSSVLAVGLALIWWAIVGAG